MNRRMIIGFLVFLCTAGVIAVFWFSQGQKEAGILLSTQKDREQKEETDLVLQEQQGEDNRKQKQPEKIVVYICGAVKQEGVYELEVTDRVSEAVQAAGGFTKKADRKAVNLARHVTDEEQIVIPERLSKDASEIETMVAGEAQGGTGNRVNINQADTAGLMTLTGIGQAKAEAIIAYRAESGSFSKVEDIMKVPGIKEGIYESIKDKICVE